MSSFRRLLPYLRPYRWHMLVVILASTSITAMNLVNPWLVRQLVQIIRVESGANAVSQIGSIAALLVVAFAVRAVFVYRPRHGLRLHRRHARDRL